MYLQFFCFKNDYIEHFLHLNTEHIESKISNIPKFSYAPGQTYRQFLTIEAENIDQTKLTNNFHVTTNLTKRFLSRFYSVFGTRARFSFVSFVVAHFR